MTFSSTRSVHRGWRLARDSRARCRAPARPSGGQPEHGPDRGRRGRRRRPVLVTKDSDFRDRHRPLRASPRRLLIVTTGNIGNDELLAIFARNLGLLVTALESAGMVELGHESLEIFEEPEL